MKKGLYFFGPPTESVFNMVGPPDFGPTYLKYKNNFMFWIDMLK